MHVFQAMVHDHRKQMDINGAAWFLSERFLEGGPWNQTGLEEIFLTFNGWVSTIYAVRACLSFPRSSNRRRLVALRVAVDASKFAYVKAEWSWALSL